MRRPSFSLALAFFYGFCVGAFVLLLFLQLTSRLVLTPRPSPSSSEASMARRPGGNVIAIPVAGIERSDLRNTWGAPRGERQHGGIDITATSGTEVVAAVAGEILRVHRSRAGGISIYMLDGSKKWLFYYAHLSAFRVGLEAGDVIERGEVIGYVGSSGNASSTNPHLHFSIEKMPDSGEWRDAVGVNPYPILLDGKLPDDSDEDAG